MLTPAEYGLLRDVLAANCLEWWLMTKDEQRLARSLINRGFLGRGRADTKQQQAQIHLTELGIATLEDLWKLSSSTP
jgi:hypothetical protein